MSKNNVVPLAGLRKARAASGGMSAAAQSIMIAPRHWQAADGLLEIFLRCSADKITMETARAQFAEFLARRFP